MRSLFSSLGENFAQNFPQPLTDGFRRNTVGQALYTQEFGFTCLGLVRAIHAEEYHEPAPMSLCLAALLLRMPHAQQATYKIDRTIELLRTNNIDERDIYLYEEQQSTEAPSTDASKSLHDAEILTWLTSEPDAMVEYVTERTGSDRSAAIRNLRNVLKAQKMYTKIGKRMLENISPTVSLTLEKLNEPRGI